MSKFKTPNSQLKWQKEYDKENMSTIAMKIPKSERETIESAAKKANLKLSTYCRACIKHCIDNDINVSPIQVKAQTIVTDQTKVQANIAAFGGDNKQIQLTHEQVVRASKILTEKKAKQSK